MILEEKIFILVNFYETFMKTQIKILINQFIIAEKFIQNNLH